MTMAPQKTLRRETSLSGKGVHTGETASVCFLPAPPGSGIRFMKNGKNVFTSGAGLPEGEDGLRCSTVSSSGEKILTVEHLLAALWGCGVTNVEINVEGPEIPVLDGSAKPFVDAFKEAGIEEQPAEKDVYRIVEPIFCSEGQKVLAAFPSEDFSVAYVLDYDHPALREQKVDFRLTPEVFEKEVAPARTFCTEKESAELRRLGFGLGADYGNTLVLTEHGPVENKLRFSDECARHKVLDILGDLYLLGFGIKGRIVGLKSGHSLNRKLAAAILKQRKGLK